MQVNYLTITPEELKRNEDVIMEFQFAFLMKNLKRMYAHLAKDGTYFGRQNLTYGKSRLYQLLQQLNRPEYDFSHISFLGFSFDHAPGETVIEFRYPILNEENYADYNNEDDLFGTKPNVDFEEKVIRIALKIKKGKIISLRIPKKVVKSLETFIHQN